MQQFTSHIASKDEGEATSGVAAAQAEKSPLCPVFLVLGFVFVGLGFVGAVLPGMPTTVFLILAAWCFSKSSDRFREWLMTHPRFGPVLQAWHKTRAIPVAAKCAAVGSMALSLSVTTFLIASSWQLPAILAAVLLPIAGWILSRPSV